MQMLNSISQDARYIGGEVRQEPGIAAMMKLQERAQIFRFGHRYEIGALGRSFVYVASKGVAGLECVTRPGERAVTQLLYPGDILVPELQAPLPDMALISRRPVEFWKLASTLFTEQTGRDSQLWRAVFLRLNAQNARSQLHTATNSALNCEERIAGFLIEIGSRLGVKGRDSLSFELPISRYSMAEYLSLNADTVSRTLSGLTAAGIIARKGRSQFSIRNWKALTEMCPLSEAIATLHGAGD